ncbi:unnamed protein product, partial [Rotaria magnacalcarata]
MTTVSEAVAMGPIVEPPCVLFISPIETSLKTFVDTMVTDIVLAGI